MKKSRQIIIIILYTLFLFFATPIFFIDLSHAAQNGESLTFYDNCEMFANLTKIGKLEHVNSIEIPLSSPGKNLTHIEMNFTNIKLEREIKTIEDKDRGFDFLFYEKFSTNHIALYVQLEIPVETIIYGIYIFGYNASTIDNYYFQINGYDSFLERPNDIIYGDPIDLNISSIPSWYLQDFSSDPITLQEGNYSIMINGTNRVYESVDPEIKWSHNSDSSPMTPYLNSGSLNERDGWENLAINTTFLHKIIRKYNETYYPEDINMTAIIDSNHYSVNNIEEGKGYLSTQIDYFIPSDQLHIDISTNETIELNITVDYSISLYKSQDQLFSLLVRENYNNSWNLEFLIDKTNYNYYDLIFNYSKYNLESVNIYNETDNINSPSVLNETEEIITLSNTTIPEGISNWRITASSKKLSNLLLDYPDSLLEIKPGQNIQFSVNAPQGNLTIIMINNNGFEKSREIIEHGGGDYDYTYLIPENAHEGTWKVYTYWNNATSAGVITQSFTVFVPFSIPPEVIINAVIIIAICSVIGGTSLQTVRVAKKRYEEKKKNLLNIFGDILNIDYFMISEKKTGLNIYEQKLGKGKPDALLITGYLDAISSFEIALTSSDERSQAIKLEFKNSKIIMSEFKGFRITLIMKQNPSKYILDSIEKLSYEINDKYGKFFENFNGQLKPFKGIDKIIEKNLRMYLTYPFKLAHLNIESLKKAERVILKRAIDLLNVMDHFYIIFLIPENKWNYRDLKIIFKLIDKKIFIPTMAKVEGKKQLK